MKNFRIVVLDYAKQQVDNPIANRVLGDMITSKQRNFVRTDENYVSLDKHDMIGTHFLIYETSDIFNPKMIFALRCTYEQRAKTHKVNLPLQDLAPKLPPDCKEALDKYRASHPSLVDCNAWFVEPEYSFKNSGINLSDIGFALVCLQILRMGHDHFIACTNEKYKAHRWLANAADFPKNFEFIHPVVPDKHMMILTEKFNMPFIKSVYEQHKDLFDNLLELTPDVPGYKTMPETIKAQFNITTEKIAPSEVKKAG
ncbi:MAG: hypothetical protein H7256_06690 [Bdellovibrio sp.]|nr:hypothetical protein [Bdellovibrio sp.]